MRLADIDLRNLGLPQRKERSYEAKKRQSEFMKKRMAAVPLEERKRMMLHASNVRWGDFKKKYIKQYYDNDNGKWIKINIENGEVLGFKRKSKYKNLEIIEKPII